MSESEVFAMKDEMWAGLGEKVEPDWVPERKWAVRAAIARRAVRRRVMVRTALVTASAGMIAVGGIALVTWRSFVAPSVAPSVAGLSSEPRTAPRATAPITGGDEEEPKAPGETVIVTQLSPDTQLAPLPNRDGRGFALRAGGARFAVPHDSSRPFVVTAGDVLIEDLGTTFTVRYVGAAADQLNIAVEEGRVRVRGGDTDTEVSAGSTLQVPVSRVALSRVGKGAHRSQRSGGVVASSWRPLAEGGQYDEAQRMLRKAGPSAVRDDTADLLLAADAARLSGHPAEAVPYLERVLRGHGSDPRAGLAAFTLGRVLLDELGRPREASEAFARARSSGGPLAEDALAREVEAASRAGDVAHSRELALLYQRLYPNGRRSRAVARFGKVD